jgi:hypothetical protein
MRRTKESTRLAVLEKRAIVGVRRHQRHGWMLHARLGLRPSPSIARLGCSVVCAPSLAIPSEQPIDLLLTKTGRITVRSEHVFRSGVALFQPCLERSPFALSWIALSALNCLDPCTCSTFCVERKSFDLANVRKLELSNLLVAESVPVSHAEQSMVSARDATSAFQDFH